MIIKLWGFKLLTIESHNHLVVRKTIAVVVVVGYAVIVGYWEVHVLLSRNRPSGNQMLIG